MGSWLSNQEPTRLHIRNIDHGSLGVALPVTSDVALDQGLCVPNLCIIGCVLGPKALPSELAGLADAQILYISWKGGCHNVKLPAYTKRGAPCGAFHEPSTTGRLRAKQ